MARDKVADFGKASSRVCKVSVKTWNNHSPSSFLFPFYFNYWGGGGTDRRTEGDRTKQTTAKPNSLWSVLPGVFSFFVPCKLRRILHCVFGFQYHIEIGSYIAVYLNMSWVLRKIFIRVSGNCIKLMKICKGEVVLSLTKETFWHMSEHRQYILTIP